MPRRLCTILFAPLGTMFDGNGYFLDFSTLSCETGNLCNVAADDLLPGFAEVHEIVSSEDGSVNMSGTLRRFKKIQDEEILWRAATFHAVIHKKNGQWMLQSFLLEEQAMG